MGYSLATDRLKVDGYSLEAVGTWSLKCRLVLTKTCEWQQAGSKAEGVRQRRSISWGTRVVFWWGEVGWQTLCGSARNLV